MAVVIKPFRWCPNGIDAEKLKVGDERDFGSITKGLVEANLVVENVDREPEPQPEPDIEPSEEEVPADDEVVVADEPSEDWPKTTRRKRR